MSNPSSIAGGASLVFSSALLAAESASPASVPWETLGNNLSLGATLMFILWVFFKYHERQIASRDAQNESLRKDLSGIANEIREASHSNERIADRLEQLLEHLLSHPPPEPRPQRGHARRTE